MASLSPCPPAASQAGDPHLPDPLRQALQPSSPQDQLWSLSATVGYLCHGNCVLKELISKHNRTDASIALPSPAAMQAQHPSRCWLHPSASGTPGGLMRPGRVFAPWGWDFLGNPEACHPTHGEGHWDCLHQPSPLFRVLGRGFAPCTGLCPGRVSFVWQGSRITPE